MIYVPANLYRPGVDRDAGGRAVDASIVFLTVVGLIFLLLTGCSNKPKSTPLPPQAVEVKVPVPVACRPVQVPKTDRPKVSKDLGIFDLTKIALADRRVLMGENDRLRAANANPCPTL